MRLHHGTNIDFGEIRLDKCSLYKDFGKGFYLTPSKQRAKLRAMDKVDKEHTGVPTIINRAELLNRIKGKKGYIQYSFCTQKAIGKLQRI